MTSTTLRGLNSTTTPLLANGTFFGNYEYTGALLSGIVNCYASTNINVTIIQNPGNIDTTLDVIISSTNIPPYTLKTLDFNLSLPYTKVVVVNLDANNQLQLDIDAIYTNLEYTSSIPTTITGDVNVINVVDISGNVNVNNVVDVSGNVGVTTLINETLATRPNYLLTIGDYYRVASVGVTTGAQWNAIGAIVGGESSPVIGRLFKCLQNGAVVGGAGTCYDVEYTTTVSLTNPTSVRIRDSNGDPIVTTAGNLMVGISNIYTANPLHTIVNSGTLSISSMPTTTAVNLGSLNTTSQLISATPKSLSGLYITHRGGTQFCFIKLYNSSSATSSDTPVATFGLYKDSMIYVDTKNLNFTTAICARGTDNYVANDNNAPSGTLDIVAFVNN
jgi:hypothetical protein